MKKLLLLITALFLLVSVEGQILRYSNYTAPTPPETYPESLDTNTEAWFIGGADKLTKDGSNKVSQWTDQSGNGNHLLQATGNKQPTWVSPDYVQFLGNWTYWMKTEPFTVSQPIYIYMVIRQDDWEESTRIFDGNTTQHVRLLQYGTTPSVLPDAGTVLSGYINSDISIGDWHIVRILYNGASSSIEVDEQGAVTWGESLGSNDLDGFTLASIATGNDYCPEISVREIIIRSAADSEATADEIYNYLKAKYNL